MSAALQLQCTLYHYLEERFAHGAHQLDWEANDAFFAGDPACTDGGARSFERWTANLLVRERALKRRSPAQLQRALAALVAGPTACAAAR